MKNDFEWSRKNLLGAPPHITEFWSNVWDPQLGPISLGHVSSAADPSTVLGPRHKVGDTLQPLLTYVLGTLLR